VRRVEVDPRSLAAHLAAVKYNEEQMRLQSRNLIAALAGTSSSAITYSAAQVQTASGTMLTEATIAGLSA
jgi:hypothetical protein